MRDGDKTSRMLRLWAWW